jgi:hypothetical protein
MNRAPPRIPQLFVNEFTVDAAAPFRRHLNCLEVEIGKEDYRHLKRVELVTEDPGEDAFARMENITARVLATTQNLYNRDLLQRLGVQVYLAVDDYAVYYRWPGRILRFVALWRHKVLKGIFGQIPATDTGWREAGGQLPGFAARFLPDGAGGVLLLRRGSGGAVPEILLTATHGPYDPHTLEVALFFLRSGKGGAALINLGFSGREPLADENLERLKTWGLPLNPSNIDVIYPYVDGRGHPYCYKLEEGFRGLVEELGTAIPRLVIDLHGCVGTLPEDRRLVVGLGGFPPWRQLDEFGRNEIHGEMVHLFPDTVLREGLGLLRELSEEIYLQFCVAPHRCYNLSLLGGLQLLGREFDPRGEVASLLPGEERNFLPRENLRWLPGAGGNALQRIEARKLAPAVLCLHVEIPTAVRRRIALKLRELEIIDSLESSAL